MKLLIVENSEIMRKGLISILQTQQEYEDILEAGNLEEAIKYIRLEKPELVIIDKDLERQDEGVEVINRAQREKVEIKYIVLTDRIIRDDFERIKKLGVKGYILKDAGIEDILYAIKRVIKGRGYYDSELIDKQHERKGDAIKELLSPKEYQVLCFLVKGMTNKQIAKQLFITENTVKKHVSSILSKLQLENRTEIVCHTYGLNK